MSPLRPSSRIGARRRAEELRAKTRALREKLRRRIPARKPKKTEKRRRWWLLVLLALLLWLFFRDCGCDEAPVVAEGPAVALGTGTPLVVPEPEPPVAPVARRPRPSFDAPPPSVLPWLVSFRMQVAARSPRLAACFVGVDRPGRLKWTAAVEPVHGEVSEHSLEPTLLSDELTEKQRDCVVGVLSDPPYRLDAADPRATPSRVSIVIEF